MHNYKQFMDLETFDNASKKAMGTHRQSPEGVQVMRALALKNSGVGKMDKAIHYITRASELAAQYISSKEDQEILHILTDKIEILLKKFANGTEEDFKEPIALAKQAMELAIKKYGEASFIANQTVLRYAIILTKVPSMEEESYKVFERAESMFDVIF